MSHCEDCGTKTYNGICQNCHEELYILDNQYEFMDKPISQQFMELADQQAKQVESRQTRS